ncbi:MAG: hypothetical protein QOD06_249 [Candidatus Binatota bacterium]|jgi:hypothetical protein|nr:hypothetical protein [Candidatus Binatota bacterium]
MAAVNEGSASHAFAVAACRECRRDVLTYADGDGAIEVRRCVHCDSRVDGDLRWTDLAGLEPFGYELDEGGEPGCVSCATGGCGVGTSVAGDGGKRAN